MGAAVGRTNLPSHSNLTDGDVNPGGHPKSIVLGHGLIGTQNVLPVWIHVLGIARQPRQRGVQRELLR
jgi:hypothetical protein